MRFITLVNTRVSVVVVYLSLASAPAFAQSAPRAQNGPRIDEMLSSAVSRLVAQQAASLPPNESDWTRVKELKRGRKVVLTMRGSTREAVTVHHSDDAVLV